MRSLSKQSAILLLAAFILSTLSLALVPGRLLAGSPGGSSVSLSSLVLPSLSPSTRPAALDSLSAEVAQRTSIPTGARAQAVSLRMDQLFDHPLLFLLADGPLPSLTVEENTVLAAWLRRGGTLVIDWQGGGSGLEEFRSGLEAFAAALFPGGSLERIPRASVVFRSFYRLSHATGRVRLVDDLYGVVIDGRYAVVVSFNDMVSAVERAADGGYKHEVLPGGAAQREDAIRFLVNLVVYALCLDYKDDKVHLDYLRSKRNWRLPGEEE